MHATGYRPPLKPRAFPVAGRGGVATIKAQLVNMRDGGFISQHDFFIASGIADVMCGGDVEGTAQVDEQWLLDLERKFFMDAREPSEIAGTHDGNDVNGQAGQELTGLPLTSFHADARGLASPLGTPGNRMRRWSQLK